MKFFAKQLVHKLNFGPGIVQKEKEVRNYPRLSQILFVVDIEENMVQVCYIFYTLRYIDVNKTTVGESFCYANSFPIMENNFPMNVFYSSFLLSF